MTVDEAIAIVASKANGRTRYDGQRDFLDEVLVSEIERLRKLVEALTEPEKLTLEFQQGKSPLITVKHWAASIMAESFWKSFKEEGGNNFVILEFNLPSEAMKLLVTIKRADGLTPEEMYGKARAELDRLRTGYLEALSRIRAYRDNWNEGWDLEDDTRAALFAWVTEEPCGQACARE